MTEVVILSEAAAYRVKEMMKHNDEEGSFASCFCKRWRL